MYVSESVCLVLCDTEVRLLLGVQLPLVSGCRDISRTVHIFAAFHVCPAHLCCDSQVTSQHWLLWRNLTGGMRALWCRSLSQSRQTAPAAASIAENGEQPEATTASRPSSTAGATSGAADDQQPPDAAAESFASAKSELTGMVNAKQQVLNRSLSSATAAFAFGAGSTVSAPKLLRSVTGVSPAAKPFAFGTAAPGLATSDTAQLLGVGQAAAAASAGFAAGQLFGFSAPATASSVPSFGTVAFGGLGSAFSFGSGNSPVPPSLQAAGKAVAAAAAAAAVKEAEQDPENDAASTHEVDRLDGTDEEGAGGEAEDADAAEADKADDEDDQEEAEADEDDSHFALPDDLLSDDDKEAPAEASLASSADVSNAEVDVTHKGDGSANSDEEEESEAAGDETDCDSI